MPDITAQKKTVSWRTLCATGSIVTLLFALTLVGVGHFKDQLGDTLYSHARINTAFSSIDLWPGDNETFLASYFSGKDWIITSVSEHTFTYFKDGDFHTLDTDDSAFDLRVSGRYIVGVRDEHCPVAAASKDIDQMTLQHKENVTHLSMDGIQYCYYDKEDISAYNLQQLKGLWSSLKFDISIATTRMHNEIGMVEDFAHGTEPVPDSAPSPVDG